MGNKKNKLELGLTYGFSYKYYGRLDMSFPIKRESEVLNNHKLTFAKVKAGYRHYFKNQRLYLRAEASLSYRIKNLFIYDNSCGPYDPWDTEKVLPMLGIGVGYSF